VDSFEEASEPDSLEDAELELEAEMEAAERGSLEFEQVALLAEAVAEARLHRSRHRHPEILPLDPVAATAQMAATLEADTRALKHQEAAIKDELAQLIRLCAAALS
jgi:HSP90 family molecular chaperone